MKQSKSIPVAQPLTVAQQRLWVREQLHPGAAQNVALGLRWVKPIDRAELVAALQELFEGHEILRTEFRTVDGTPLQVVSSSAHFEMNPVDLLHFSQAERADRLASLAQQEIGKPFDLTRESPLRAVLFDLAETEHMLLLVAHRIVCDRASLGILLRELHFLCEARRNGGAPHEAQLAPQYREVAIEGHGVLPDQSYWTKRFAEAPTAVEMPTDRPRPLVQSFRSASERMKIGASLTERLKSLGESQRATLFSTLLSAFGILLSRYARQEDLVLGTRVSGRGRAETKIVVGPLENLLALRIDTSGNPSFAEFLTRVREVVDGALAHQEFPFETLIQQLRLQRDMGRHPLFQIMLTMQDADTAIWDLGPDVTLVEFEHPMEQFDLSVEFAEQNNEIEARFSYNPDLFDASTITRMMGHFRILLESAAENPDLKISRMPLLSKAERHQLLVEWNDTPVPYPGDVPLHEFIEEQVEKTPDSVAVIYESERLTYRQLNSRANQLAHRLKKYGVGPDVLVGVCAERSLALVVALLAILKAGGAYVPLDPEYPKDRLADILEDAKAPILLTQERSARALPAHGARLIRLDADWPEVATESTMNPARDVAARNLAYVLFTSGSTGRPKGVALEHRSAAIFVQWAREVFLPEEVAGTLFSTSICFDLSVFEIFVPLSMGGKVIIAQNTLALPRLPAAHEVTLINTVPSAIVELLRMRGVPASVRVVNLAGEALSTILVQRIYEETAARKVYNLYGPTEDTTYSTYTLLPRGGDVSIGRPLPNTQAYILDENRQPVPIGVPGELYLAGDGLARGYFGREDLTRERFVANPFSNEQASNESVSNERLPNQSGTRMYRTGDLARFLGDGNIEYLGRIDNQVKVRGFRIELEEIESALAQHSSVQSAVVVAREDAPGDKRLVAYVVPSKASISAPILKDLIRQRLPEYMVPTTFVEMKALPLSPNGKINRRMLPAPEQPTMFREEVVRPRNDLESMLVGIWQRVLGVPNIGVQDDFFDLGGHSLLAVRVLMEVEQVIGKELPLSALFRSATVESLAQWIERESEVEPDLVVMEIQHGESNGASNRLPFFAIVPPGEESLGYAMLARHMGPEQTVYKIQGHAPVTRGTRPYSESEMRALTEEYITAIRSVQPHGPYCLGGLCDGTHIAEQIVLKLESQGNEVGLFAIFDTWVLQHSQNRWLWKIYYFGQRLREIRGESISKRLASYKRLAENKVQNLVGVKPGRTDWRQAYWPEGFTPARFRAPVILFKRPKQPFYYINDPQMGWGARTTGGVEIHEVDFHHLEILREPQVGIFGRELAERMARVAGSPSASTEIRRPSFAIAVPGQQGS